jgi:protein-S-isoprenylcysteine O-methyltransferase Ste14
MSATLTGLSLALTGALLHAAAMRRVKRLCREPYLLEQPVGYLVDGVFRLRHPAYLGALLEIAGFGILALGWGGAAVALAALPFYADRILREERIRRGSEGQQIIRARKAA